MPKLHYGSRGGMYYKKKGKKMYVNNSHFGGKKKTIPCKKNENDVKDMITWNYNEFFPGNDKYNECLNPETCEWKNQKDWKDSFKQPKRKSTQKPKPKPKPKPTPPKPTPPKPKRFPVCDDFWNWGWNDSMKTFNKIKDNKDSMKIYARLKPSDKKKDKKILGVKNNTITNLCLLSDEKRGKQGNEYEIKTVQDCEKKSCPNITFDKVFHGNETNKQVYQDTLQKKIQGFTISENDRIVVFAYGQSGSGKSYTILGDETNFTGNPGIINYALQDIKNKFKGYKIKLLPLQIYMGSVYNAFYGDENEMKITNENENENFEWFDDHKELIIPEFNVLDMIDHKIPNRLVPENNYKYNNNKLKKDDDPYLINYPPVDSLLECLFKIKYKKGTGNNENNGHYVDVTDDINISEFIYENVIPNRPVRSTDLNPDSSRSHLFLIFQISNGKNTKYLTFVDLAGYEKISEPKNIKEYEGYHITNSGIVPFRKMIQSYKGITKSKNIFVSGEFNEPSEVISINKNALIQYKVKTEFIRYNGLIKTKNEIISDWNWKDDNMLNFYPIIDENGKSKLTYDITKGETISTSMFNLIRATSGMLSGNKADHVIYAMAHQYASNEDIQNKCRLNDSILFGFIKDMLEN